MNNLQYIVKDNTRYAMHVAVELCEQGDFDSIREALIWLRRESDDAELGNGTLTAEQVKRIHEIIEKHWHDLPAEYDMPEATALPECSHDWQAIADELNAELGSDDEYEAKMDALLCRLTNGKWSKTRQYSLEFMVSCVDEEYEDAYEKERAELGSETCECVAEYAESPIDGKTVVLHRCSACHELMRPFMNYCPNCGKRIRKTVEQ